MATKKNETDKLSEKSYSELERMAQQAIEALSKEDLPLDEAKKIFDEGTKILARMQKKLEQMRAEATDAIDEGKE